MTEFEIASSTAPEVLLWGFVELHALFGLDAQVRCAAESDDIASISIHDASRSIDIKMYRLPAADTQFTDDLKFFGQQPKSWPLPAGRAFDAGILYPQGVPIAWKHKAIQIGAPGIVHAARGGGRGLIVRHVFDSQSMLSHPMFQWFEKKLVVIENAWKVDPPKLHAPRFDDEVSAVAEEPLSQEELDQVADNAMRAWDALHLTDKSTRDQVITAIHDMIEELRPKYATLKPNVLHNMTVSFGSLWGQMLCGAAGWEWIGLSQNGDESFLALASPDRAHVIAPVNLMLSNLQSETDENTVRLTFNMIEAGKLPPSTPQAYLMLSKPS